MRPRSLRRLLTLLSGGVLLLNLLLLVPSGHASPRPGGAAAPTATQPPTIAATATPTRTATPTATAAPTATPWPTSTQRPTDATGLPLEHWPEADPTEWVLPPPPTPTPLPTVAAILPPPTAEPDLPAAYAADGRPIVYLTFDDGLVRPTSLDIVDLLARHGAQATFFVLGDLIDKDPDLARTVSAAGHAIQNHTYHHVALDSLAAEELVAELMAASNAIEAAIGVAPRCVRPPWGAANEITRQIIAEMGLTVVKWDVDPQDWRRPGTDAIVQSVLDDVYPGAIVLLHDGPGDRSQTIEALEIILQELESAGYVFEALRGW